MIVANDKIMPFKGYEAIDAKQLQTFAYEYPGRNIELLIETDEFTAVCPFSGLPDFGTVKIVYTPKNVCIELRSFKYYLHSYRDVGIYYEHAVNRILEDLVNCCDPEKMIVELKYKARGGMFTWATAAYPGTISKKS